MTIEKLKIARDLLTEYLAETKRPSRELNDEVATTRQYFKLCLSVVEHLIRMKEV